MAAPPCAVSGRVMRAEDVIEPPFLGVELHRSSSARSTSSVTCAVNAPSARDLSGKTRIDARGSVPRSAPRTGAPSAAGRAPRRPPPRSGCARSCSTAPARSERAFSSSGVPFATIAPRSMMIARVHAASTSSRMCVEKTIAFLLAHPPDQRPHLVLLVGIEPVGRLVQDQHVGIVDQRLREAGAMAEALGERVDRLVQHRFEEARLDHAVDRLLLRPSPRSPRISAANPRKAATVMSV